MSVSIILFVIKAEISQVWSSPTFGKKGPVPSNITLLKTSFLFECCYDFIFGENGAKHCFCGTRDQSNAKFCQCSKGDGYGECKVVGSKTGDWKRPFHEEHWPWF